MQKTKKSKGLLATASAFALAATLGLVGCGGGEGVDDVAEPADSTPATEAPATSDKPAATTATGTDFEMTEAEIYEGYAGVTADGSATAYYFGDADLTKGGLVLMSEDATEHVSWMGPIEVGEGTDGSTVIQITDSTTGNTVGFSVVDNGDGTMTLDLGDDGSIMVKEVAKGDIIDAINAIQEQTTNAA